MRERNKERETELEREASSFEADAHFYVGFLCGRRWFTSDLDKVVSANVGSVYMHISWLERLKFSCALVSAGRLACYLFCPRSGREKFRKLKHGGTYALNWWLVIKVAVSAAQPRNYFSRKNDFMRVQWHCKVPHGKGASYGNIYEIRDEWEEI